MVILITQVEFTECFNDECIRAHFAALELETDNPEALFILLDPCGEGEIDSDTFVGRCLSLRGNAKKLEITRLSQKTGDIENYVSALQNVVEKEGHLIERHGNSNRSAYGVCYDESNESTSSNNSISKFPEDNLETENKDVGLTKAAGFAQRVHVLDKSELSDSDGHSGSTFGAMGRNNKNWMCCCQSSCQC